MHNFSLVIALDKALPGSREAAGPPPGPAEGIGSRMQLRVRSLAMHNACAGAYGVLATDVGVKGVSLDVEQPSQLPSSFPGASSQSDGSTCGLAGLQMQRAAVEQFQLGASCESLTHWRDLC